MINKIKKKIKDVFFTKPVINYFNTNYKKTVLISYITAPFNRYKGFYNHTNNGESLIIAKVFKNLGFNVDIFNFDYTKKIDYSKYDVIFGFGEPLINSFYNRKKNISTIYYGTGMHVCFQNHNTLKRIKEVYDKKGVWVPESGRIVEKTWSIQTSIVNNIITFGNETVINSYKKYFNGNIFNIPVSYYKIFSEESILEMIKEKDFAVAKYHFLWFGGSGAIHKGLDLLLDIFSKRNDCHLHICGPVENEINFKNIYYKELYETPNIHTYGFVDLKSTLFEDLIKKCAFVIFPSCSEGESSSVINVMANGMIPIVTKESGIKISKSDFLIDDISSRSIEKTINLALLSSEQDLYHRSCECLKKTRENHSIEKFEEKLFQVLNKIL